jgi:hypothetical protein
MIGRRGLLLLGGAAVATIGGAYFLKPQNESEGVFVPGTLAFPGLAPRLAERAEDRAGPPRPGHHAQPRRRQPGASSRSGGYPARGERIRELLTGLTELRLVEERTSDPARHAEIGVDDPAATAAPPPSCACWTARAA